MRCDLYGVGPCEGKLYRFGVTSIKRCARHVKLQAFWTDLPMRVVSADFDVWALALEPAQVAMIMRGRVIAWWLWEEVEGEV